MASTQRRQLAYSSAFVMALGVFSGAVAPSFALAQQAAQAQQQAVNVLVSPVRSEAVAGSISLVGQISAINRVDVRARVEGYLQDVLFEEGGTVKAGDKLYQIEPDLFQAAVTQAQGALDRATAQQTLAKTNLDRSQQLLNEQIDSVARRDQNKAAYDSATADVLTSQGQLKDAQIKLGYTTITAPVDGVIGRTSITKGNLIGPTTGVLTTIVSEDPIYALFQISEVAFRKLRTQSQANPSTVKVYIGFSDGTQYDQVGKIDFIDSIVSQSTDTIQVRASFPNPDGVLRDGQLIRVKLESGEPQNRLVIDQGAVIADQGGLYVFVVKDGKAVQQTVKLGDPVGPNVVVRDGLKEGDQVIVDGLERVRPGSPVVAKPAKVSGASSAGSGGTSAPASGGTSAPASDGTTAPASGGTSAPASGGDGGDASGTSSGDTASDKG